MKQLLFTLLIVSLSQIASAYAEDQHADVPQNVEPSAVKIYVRTIEASQHIDGERQDGESASIDPSLSDISHKLNRLPFQSFRLVGSKEQELSLKRKDTLKLADGQSLTFRPLYTDNKRVGLWLSWRDRAGTDILNTRVHFDCGDSVLTGTDSSPDGGMILAIRAAPVGQ